MTEYTMPVQDSGVPLETVRVTVVEGPDQGKTISAQSDRLSVGTAEPNDLSLTDETVSRYHLDLERKPTGILLVDHASTNGTFLGSARIERAHITPGTVLKLGKTKIKVDDGAPIRMEAFEGNQLGGVISGAPSMRTLMARMKRVAASDASVLVLGESGTGKEVVARALHALSPRSEEPLETLDCGSMPPTLIASELFGHEKGAFTGAERRHIGAFERADGGTLFLDEIGELPPVLQTNLLGALERRSFRRVGGKEKISIDVRLVCATNRDLRAEVNAATFRLDLYYRIAVVHLQIPPLRDRLEDLPLLIEHFARQAGFDGPLEALTSDEALAAMRKHRWPGNVRELRNAVEAALVMGEAPELAPGPDIAANDRSLAVGDIMHLPYSEARNRLLESFEENYIRELLERTDFNVSEASRQARVNRSYLTRLIKKRGIRIQRGEG